MEAADPGCHLSFALPLPCLHSEEKSPSNTAILWNEPDDAEEAQRRISADIYSSCFGWAVTVAVCGVFICTVVRVCLGTIQMDAVSSSSCLCKPASKYQMAGTPPDHQPPLPGPWGSPRSLELSSSSGSSHTAVFEEVAAPCFLNLHLWADRGSSASWVFCTLGTAQTLFQCPLITARLLGEHQPCS